MNAVKNQVKFAMAAVPFLNVVYDVMSQDGWVPKTKETPDNPSTVTTALDLIKNHPEAVASIMEDNNPSVMECIRWATGPDNWNENLKNKLIGQGLQDEQVVNDYTAGLIGSALRQYQNWLDKQERLSQLVHVGELGQTIELPVRLMSIQDKKSSIDGRESKLVLFEDESGNQLTYWSDEVPDMWYDNIRQPGDLYCFIKQHKNYRGVNQTLVTRAKFRPYN